MFRMPPLALLFGCAVLSACTSTEATLDPSAIAPGDRQVSNAQPLPSPTATGTAQTAAPGTAPPPAAAAPQAPATPAAPAQTAALSSAIRAATRVQFAPIVGATVDTVTPLTERLSRRARERGLRLASSGEANATHVMKGYFSADRDDGKATVYYVWDVVDPAGNRLHRIFGQETFASTGSDPWSNVPPATMEAIANRTIDDLAAWLSTQG